MTSNCTRKSATSGELHHPPGEHRTGKCPSPSTHGGHVWQPVLQKAMNRAQRRLSARTASDRHKSSLSVQDECKLAERIKAGDQLAQHQLVLANRKLVFRVVNDYQSCGLSEDDLIQEGNVGLIRAAQNFDPTTHGIRFSSYALFWIRATIQRAISNGGGVVRLPEHTRLLRERYLRALRELGKEREAQTHSAGSELPTRAEIARYLRVSPRLVDRALLVRGEQALPDEEDATRTDSQTAESTFAQQEERAAVHAALRRLSPFEAWVIRERFGLGEWSTGPLAPKHPSNTAASCGKTDETRTELPAAAVNSERGCTYYGRTFEDLSRDSGLTVHRLRLIARAALDRLRYILSPAAAERG
jgi:RNA polymerase primary sigma factor